MSSPPLFLLLVSGEHEKIQMAGMMASVAAVSERPVEVFVSMNAVYAFRKDAAGDSRYKGGAFSDLMKEKKAPDAVDLKDQPPVVLHRAELDRRQLDHRLLGQRRARVDQLEAIATEPRVAQQRHQRLRHAEQRRLERLGKAAFAGVDERRGEQRLGAVRLAQRGQQRDQRVVIEMG